VHLEMTMTDSEMAKAVMAIGERIEAAELKRRTNKLYTELRNAGIMKGSVGSALGKDPDFRLEKQGSHLFITRLH
jgi:hypothetical protein